MSWLRRTRREAAWYDRSPASAHRPPQMATPAGRRQVRRRDRTRKDAMRLALAIASGDFGDPRKTALDVETVWLTQVPWETGGRAGGRLSRKRVQAALDMLVEIHALVPVLVPTKRGSVWGYKIPADGKGDW